MPEDWQQAGFGLYLHWPFCQAKCPYCDFNSHVAAAVDQDRWRRAYATEIRRVGAETGPRVLNTVFLGGGTPSLMAPDLVAAVLNEARQTWPVANELEVTLEANPSSVEAGRFRGYRDAGVNRVSLGAQALNDTDLRALGRLHDAAEARAALEIARATFDRVSFDLIYARQNQSLAGWRAELTEALSFGVDHLSLYQLTVEDGTAFGDRQARGRLPGLPDQDLAADLYEATQEICAGAGLPAYEISNHARPGAVSQHNFIYWRSGDWAGIGPGAHGRLTTGGVRHAIETPLAPGKWLDLVERTGNGEAARTPLDAHDRTAEMLMMGLRTVEGVALKRLEAIPGYRLFLRNINSLAEGDWIEIADGRIRATESGRPLLNAILRDVMPVAEPA